MGAMCKQKTVLKTLKKMAKDGELDDFTIVLAEAQAQDYKYMDDRMEKIETEVQGLRQDFGTINQKVDNMGAKLDRVQSLLEVKTSVKTNIRELLSNKIFLIILFILLALSSGYSLTDLVSAYISLK